MPPQSLQPFAVMDALVALGLSDLTSLRVTCLDINSRVVDALRTSARRGALLTIASSLQNPLAVPTGEFTSYVEMLGRAISTDPPMEPAGAFPTVAVSADGVAALDPRQADVVFDRVALGADLVVVTNVLPYFDDRELALALPDANERPCYGTPGFYRGKILFARLLEDGESIVVKIDFPERAALCELRPDTFVVTPHYRDYAMMIVRLATVKKGELTELLEGAWRRAAPAPKKRRSR